MKIAYLNKVKLNSNLPAVNFTLFNAYALAQAGAECFLMVQQDNDAPLDDVYKKFDIALLNNFHIKAYPVKRYLGIKTNQWFYIKAFKNLLKMINHKNLNVIITRDPGALPYLAILRKRTGIAVFYQPHNFYVDLAIRPDVNPRNAYKYHLLEKLFIPRMNALLCLQETQARWYKRYFPNQHIYAAKPGINKIQTVENDRYHNKMIGYIGSLQSMKGIDTLLRALSLIRNEGYKLILIGGRNDAEINHVKKLVKDLDLTDQVKITGWIPYTEVQVYLRQLSVGIIPLNNTFYNRYLTAPNKLFDYLSFGIPVIVSDLPAIRDFIAENIHGKFFNPEKPEELAQVIKELFSNPNEYNKLAANVVKKAQEFSWERRALIMLEWIEKAL